MCHSPYYQQCIDVVKILMFPKKDNFIWNVPYGFQKYIVFFFFERADKQYEAVKMFIWQKSYFR